MNKKLIERQLGWELELYLWEKLNKNIYGEFESKLSMEIERKLWSGFGRELTIGYMYQIKRMLRVNIWRTLNEQKINQ
jgi:hypothetical protein